ncbi:hypothetical protein GCM10027435_06980 [Haloparvum alkalitolerans]|uniref:hypothetical protein n=1 Tax=Haloparvum alkalitolerans TaxID=1042953 RepID=UPI003CF96EF0
MTETPAWRDDATDLTLRLLYQSGIAVSVDGIVANLAALAESAPPADAVEEAVAKLRKRDHVRALSEADRFYLLTDRGREYVEAEVDAEAFGYVD